MQYIDYYKVLGLNKSASQDEIKKAYRRLARKYHPDVSKESDAEARFKEVGEAYEVLKDPEKRQQYDTLGANWKNGQDFHTPPGWEGFSGGAGGASGFSDFFDSMFGGGFNTGGRGGFHQSGFEDIFGQNGYGAQKGEDITVQLKVTLEQVYHGEHVNVRLSTGKALKVKIPKGIAEGKKIRLSGQGHEGMGGGPKGDLFVEVRYAPHTNYTVDGKNIELTLPIAPWEAALGASVSAPTLSGIVQLKVPAGSTSGKRLRLKGRGMPGKETGDFYVRLQVDTPAIESDAQREAYEALQAAFDYDPRAKMTL